MSAIGGVQEKVEAAERWGLKRVIIPTDNYKTHPISEMKHKYKVEILHASTVGEYFELLRGDRDED